jgi:hypothetical protein
MDTLPVGTVMTKEQLLQMQSTPPVGAVITKEELAAKFGVGTPSTATPTHTPPSSPTTQPGGAYSELFAGLSPTGVREDAPSLVPSNTDVTPEAEAELQKAGEQEYLRRIGEKEVAGNTVGENFIRGIKSVGPEGPTNTGTYAEKFGAAIPTVARWLPAGLAAPIGMAMEAQGVQNIRDDVPIQTGMVGAAGRGTLDAALMGPLGMAGRAIGGGVSAAKGASPITAALARGGGELTGNTVGLTASQLITSGELPSYEDIVDNALIGSILMAPNFAKDVRGVPMQNAVRNVMEQRAANPRTFVEKNPIVEKNPLVQDPVDTLSRALYEPRITTDRAPETPATPLERNMAAAGRWELGQPAPRPADVRPPSLEVEMPTRSTRSTALGTKGNITDTAKRGLERTLAAREREYNILRAAEAEGLKSPAKEQRKQFLQQQIPLIRERLGLTNELGVEGTETTGIGTSTIVRQQKKEVVPTKEEIGQVPFDEQNSVVPPDGEQPAYRENFMIDESKKAEPVAPSTQEQRLAEFPDIPKTTFTEIHRSIRSREDAVRAITSSKNLSPSEKTIYNTIARMLPESFYKNSGHQLSKVGIELRIGGWDARTTPEKVVAGTYKYTELREQRDRMAPGGDTSTRHFEDAIAIYNERSPVTFAHEVGHNGMYRLLDEVDFNQLISIYKNTPEYEMFQQAIRDGDASFAYKNSLDEWFADKFADYLMGKAINVEPKVEPAVRRVFDRALVALYDFAVRVKGLFKKEPEIVGFMDRIIKERNIEPIGAVKAQARLRSEGLNVPDNLKMIPRDSWIGPEPKMPRFAKKGTDAAKIEDILEAQHNKGVEEARRTVGAAHALRREFLDRSGNAVAALKRIGTTAAKEARIRFELLPGVRPYVDREVQTLSKRIYKGITPQEEILLNGIIQARRTIAIDAKYKGVKHPGDTTGKQWQAWLDTVPKKVRTKLEERADRFFDVMKDQLTQLRKARIITEETYQRLLDRSPYATREFFETLDPAMNIQFGKKGIISVNASGLHNLGAGDIGLIRNNSRLMLDEVVRRTQGRIWKNNANRALYRVATENPDNGLVRVLGEKDNIPAGHTEVSVFHEGKEYRMAMPSEIAYEWTINDPVINSNVANILSWIMGSKTLKASATGYNPVWSIANLIMDMAGVYTNTMEYSSALPVYGVQRAIDYAATAKDAFARRGAYNDYIKQGGGMELLSQQGFLSSKHARKIQEVVGYLNTTSEIWGRLALRHRALKNGKSPMEATWVARHYLDFSRGGRLTKAVDPVFPYLNASIQGTKRMFEAAHDNPAMFTFKMAQVIALGVGMSLAAMKTNEEAYDSIPEEVKNANLIIVPPLPSYIDENGYKRYHYFAIPINQGQRPFVTLARNIANLAMGKEFDTGQVAKSFTEFLTITPESYIPPVVKGFFEYMSNIDIYKHEQIYKGPPVEPKDEYDDSTNPFFVKAGEQGNLSPKRLEKAVQNLFTYDNTYLSMMGYGIRELYEDNKEEVDTNLLDELSQITGLRRFVKRTNPYAAFEDEHELAQMEEGSRRATQDREFQPLIEAYWKNRTPENLEKVKAFMRRQDAVDIERFEQAFFGYELIANNPNKAWWLSLQRLTPEVRARMFYKKREKAEEKEKEELNKIAAKFFPFSDRFWYELGELQAAK